METRSVPDSRIWASRPSAAGAALDSAGAALVSAAVFYAADYGLPVDPLHALVPPQPQSRCEPALWRYGDVRPHLMRAGEVSPPPCEKRGAFQMMS